MNSLLIWFYRVTTINRTTRVIMEITSRLSQQSMLKAIWSRLCISCKLSLIWLASFQTSNSSFKICRKTSFRSFSKVAQPKTGIQLTILRHRYSNFHHSINSKLLISQRRPGLAGWRDFWHNQTFSPRWERLVMEPSKAMTI